ncbi:aldehyde dehydrogenase [Gordonia sp. HY002]|nr:aldehyde dehydrogenase [Gordonia zhenghanii]
MDGSPSAVVNPATEDQIATVTAAGARDVDAAVTSARKSFDDPGGWSKWSADDRGAVLERFADELEARSSDIAQAVTSQNGMPISLSSALEAAFPALLLRFYASVARRDRTERRDGMLGGKLEVRHTPYGVVGAIAPWNYPQTLSAMKFAPALASGCTVVLKAPIETPLDARLTAEAAIAAGIPDGVFNILPGSADAGRALVAHTGVDKVAFTGSTATGRAVGRQCGDLLRPVTLELGGKSAAIILDDADLAGSVESLFGAIFINNGQTCFRSSRVLAPRNRYAEIVDLLASLSADATMGDPLDPRTAVGPLVNGRARTRVEDYISIGRRDGTLVTGGGRPDRPGYYVPPTVFADVRNDSAIVQEEIFGPVVTVHSYDSEDDAVALANDSNYGLGGTVWSTDLERAASVARRVATGTIGINGYTPDPAGPFGGVKNSGIGREFGPEGYANYVQSQTIYLG